MIFLDDESLFEALIACATYQHYKVSIVFGSMRSASRFADEFYKLNENDGIPLVDAVAITEFRRNVMRVFFKNGSMIEVIVPITSDDVRGTRRNKILLERGAQLCPDVYDALCWSKVAYSAYDPAKFSNRGGKFVIDVPDEITSWVLRQQGQIFDDKQDGEELDKFLNTFVVT